MLWKENFSLFYYISYHQVKPNVNAKLNGEKVVTSNTAFHLRWNIYCVEIYSRWHIYCVIQTKHGFINHFFFVSRSHRWSGPKSTAAAVWGVGRLVASQCFCTAFATDVKFRAIEWSGYASWGENIAKLQNNKYTKAENKIIFLSAHHKEDKII